MVSMSCGVGSGANRVPGDSRVGYNGLPASKQLSEEKLKQKHEERVARMCYQKVLVRFYDSSSKMRTIELHFLL